MVKEKKKLSKTPTLGVSHKIQREINTTSYLFLLPFAILFISFVLIPIFIGIYTSFFDYTLKGLHFNWGKNYLDLFKDRIFWKSMGNTLLLVIVAVPCVIFFSLWAASALNDRNKALTGIFRGVFYLPVVMGTVPVIVVWKWIFNAYYGILNYLLKSAKLMPQTLRFDWLGEKSTAIWCILLILFTTSIGQPIVLYIASLGDVNKNLIEAAEVDGASRFRIFWQIKWPYIMPTTLYIGIITTINTFQCFSLIQLLTSGGPSYSTSTVMYYLYEMAFTHYQFGYANAIGVILLVVIGLFSLAELQIMRRRGAE